MIKGEGEEQKIIPMERVSQKLPFPFRGKTPWMEEVVQRMEQLPRVGVGVILILMLFFLTGCSKEDENKPGKVRWDRETCARCAMALSDRNYSAQIRGGRPDRETRLYKFDDIGCAVIWLDQQNWKTDPRTKIWVNDHRNGSWIDAKTAWYVKVKSTPMDYGLGAQSDNEPEALNYDEARAHIYKQEERLNTHYGQPHPTPPAIPILEEETQNQ